jgi:serine phosphatase RsbU (regulator of sigma subunit)
MSSFVLLATGNLLLGGLVFLLGLIILRENPRQSLNRVVAFMLFLGGLGSIITALGFLGPREGGEAARLSPSGTGLLQNFAYVWEFFFPTLFLFASIFPRERGFTRRFRSYPLVVYAPHAFHFLLLLGISLFAGADFTSIRIPGLLSPVAQILNLFFQVFLAIHRALFSLVNLGYGTASAVLLLSSLRQARLPRLKKQLRAIGAGLTACLVLYSFATSIPILLNLSIPDWARGLLTVGALTVASASISYAMVRHKFLDTKLLARRAILYAVASAILVGFYLTVVSQLSRLLSGVWGMDVHVLEPVFLVMALILFQPAITRLEERLEHVFLSDRGDYRNVLRSLGSELRTVMDLNEMLFRSIHTIGETLMLRSAHVAALDRALPIVHTGAGDPPSPEALAALPDVLRRLPLDEESLRLDEEDERIAPGDRGLLAAGFGASLAFPLHSKGEMLGALLLGDKETGTEYTADDVALLSSLAGQISISVQNGLLLRDRVEGARMEEEMNLARKIQSTFLPSVFPPMPRFEAYAVNNPSRHVGGDFYDLVQTGNGSFYLAIADVSGKGVPAALLTSMLQASLRTQAESSTSVSDIVSRINRLVSRSTTTEQFATFFLARVETSTMRMVFSNAGHNPPIVRRRRGERVLLERGGMVVGLFETSRYEEDVLDLQAGDRVVFYTDGISEATNRSGEDYGEGRLLDLVQTLPVEMTAREATERVLEDLYRFLDGVEPQDDVTLMVLRVL